MENDAAMKQYREIIAKYGGGVNGDDGQVLYGVAKAEAFVQALTRAGKNPTRKPDERDPEHELPEQVLAPGCCQKTTKADYFVISQMQLQRLNANTKLFVPFGRPSRVARGARANSFSLRVTGTRAGKPA